MSFIKKIISINRSYIKTTILQVKFLGWMDVCKAENIYYRTGAYSSVVAAWNADQKDTSTYFITILIALLYFKSEGCWFESREEQIFKIRSTQI